MKNVASGRELYITNTIQNLYFIVIYFKNSFRSLRRISILNFYILSLLSAALGTVGPCLKNKELNLITK